MKENKILKRKIYKSYLTSTISISLVLFLLGIVGLLLINAQKLSNKIKESINLTVVINKNSKEVDIRELQKRLDANRIVKSTMYNDKDEAAKNFAEELGQDFVDFLGYNPLYNSIDIFLYADYIEETSINKLKATILKNNIVKEVIYHKSFLTFVTRNLKKITFFILVFCGFLMLTFLSLINNTIRITIYSKRFLINTMQLVGATDSFIRKPFIVKNIVYGVMSAIIVNSILTGIIYYFHQEHSHLLNIKDTLSVSLLYLFILFLSVIITYLSTYFSLNKYLRLKTDELYF